MTEAEKAIREVQVWRDAGGVMVVDVKHAAALLAEIERLREWNRQMVEKAASGGTLDGYRELGAKLANAEAEIERLRATVDRLQQQWAENAPAVRYKTERDALRTALRDCDAVARARGDKYGLCDQIDNGGSPYPSQWLADLLAQTGANDVDR